MLLMDLAIEKCSHKKKYLKFHEIFNILTTTIYVSV